jgi:hypothetical protein
LVTYSISFLFQKNENFAKKNRHQTLFEDIEKERGVKCETMTSHDGNLDLPGPDIVTDAT